MDFHSVHFIGKELEDIFYRVILLKYDTFYLFFAFKIEHIMYIYTTTPLYTYTPNPCHTTSKN